MKILSRVLALWMTGLSAAFAAPNTSSADSQMAARPVRVVLVGASIGQDWNLSDLPKRTLLSGYELEALQAWQYDKSELLDETLMRPSRKFRFTPGYFKGLFTPSPQPADVVILKECSSYFPGDTDPLRKQQMVERWIQQVKEKNIKVMLTTVVPVTKTRAMKNQGKQEGVREYNNWARDYARNNQIGLVDLEAALRTDAKERYLRDDLTSGDGSHLNRKAYDILDRVMIQALCQLKPSENCVPAGTRAK